MGYRIEYKGKNEFIVRLVKSGIARITAENYARVLVRNKGPQSMSARNNWRKMMSVELPNRYHLVNVHSGKRKNEDGYVPDYIIDEAEDISPLGTSQRFYGKDYVEEVVEEERKGQVSLLLDIMKDVMDSDIQSEAKLEVVRIFMERMETIEWAM